MLRGCLWSFTYQSDVASRDGFWEEWLPAAADANECAISDWSNDARRWGGRDESEAVQSAAEGSAESLIEGGMRTGDECRRQGRAKVLLESGGCQTFEVAMQSSKSKLRYCAMASRRSSLITARDLEPRGRSDAGRLFFWLASCGDHESH